MPMLVLAAMAASTLPLWFVQTPPLIDLLGHMGRYHIQLNLADSPALQAHWQYQWALIGNLGVDLLMEPLGRLLGVERATWLVAALLPPLMILGIVQLARAWHGEIPPTIIAAFPLALAYPWQYGLVNYWLGAALAFHAAAFAAARPRIGASAPGLVLLSLGLWVCHVYGWAIFAILESARVLADAPVREWHRRLARLLPLGAPVLVMLALSYGQHNNAVTDGWFVWHNKLSSLLFVLRDQDFLFDILSLIAVMSVVLAPFREHMRFARVGLIAAAVLVAATFVLPYRLLGSAWADGRLWPIVLMVLIASACPSKDAPPLARRLLPALLLALFLARLIVGAFGFAAYDRAYRSHLAALDRVERGARVAAFVRFPCLGDWRRTRLEHLDGMAIVRRDAFTNGQWDVPGAQLVTPLAARGTLFNSDPSELVGLDYRCMDDLRPRLAETIAHLPRERFDYVWVLDFDPRSLPSYPGLVPVFTDERTILYRIARP
jgi:hypothetical protein